MMPPRNQWFSLWMASSWKPWRNYLGVRILPCDKMILTALMTSISSWQQHAKPTLNARNDCRNWSALQQSGFPQCVDFFSQAPQGNIPPFGPRHQDTLSQLRDHAHGEVPLRIRRCEGRPVYVYREKEGWRWCLQNDRRWQAHIRHHGFKKIQGRYQFLQRLGMF